MASEGMPWETGATEGKYRYHPGGDPQAAPKDAPSAVNVVVIPDVNLPKVCPRADAPSCIPGGSSSEDRKSLYLGNSSPDIRIKANSLRIAPPRQVQQMGQGRLLDIFTGETSQIVSYDTSAVRECGISRPVVHSSDRALG